MEATRHLALQQQETSQHPSCCCCSIRGAARTAGERAHEAGNGAPGGRGEADPARAQRAEPRGGAEARQVGERTHRARVPAGRQRVEHGEGRHICAARADEERRGLHRLQPSLVTRNPLRKLSHFVECYLLRDSFSRQSNGITDLVLYGDQVPSSALSERSAIIAT